MSHVDVYMFPCYHCGGAKTQMTKQISDLRSNDVKYGMLWIDVEGTSYWSTSCKSNVEFLMELVATAVSSGINVGIYTSKSQWDPIMGDRYALQ